MRRVEVLALAVDFEGEHAGCDGEVVRVVEGDAEVVGFCGGFVGVDVGCEGVVGGLPLGGGVSGECWMFTWRIRGESVGGVRETVHLHIDRARSYNSRTDRSRPWC